MLKSESSGRIDSCHDSPATPGGLSARLGTLKGARPYGGLLLIQSVVASLRFSGHGYPDDSEANFVLKRRYDLIRSCRFAFEVCHRR